MDLTLGLWGNLSKTGRLRGRRAPERNGNENMSDASLPARPKRHPNCHVRDLDGEQVVYVPDTHEVVVLNATARFIFEQCDGTRTRDEVLDALQGRYAAERNVLARDLDATLKDLCGKGVLVG